MSSTSKSVETRTWKGLARGYQVTTARALGIDTHGKGVTENQVGHWLKILDWSKPKLNITFEGVKMIAVQIHPDDTEVVKVMYENSINV